MISVLPLENSFVPHFITVNFNKLENYLKNESYTLPLVENGVSFTRISRLRCRQN